MSSPGILDAEAALGALDCSPDLLSSEQRATLDHDGLVVLENHMSPQLLEELRLRYDDLTDHVNLVDKGDVFAEVFTDPTVLTAALHVLGRPFRLFATNGRTAMPGGGGQRLHADWPQPVTPGRYSIVNSMWLLDDFTELNGATRYVPGSHRSGRMPTDDLADPMDPHPEERRLVAPAGSIAIINAHVWHGGTLNRSTQPRRLITCAFADRETEQQTVQRQVLAPEVVAGLAGPVRWLVDV